MATGSTEAASNYVKQENVNGPICPICIDQFKTPRALPCLHTFCEKCILSLIYSRSGDASKTNRFECPVCRRDTSPPLDITEPSQWVKIFPVNHYVPTRVGNDEDAQTKPCDPCLSKDILSIATTFCVNCTEYLCANCGQNHKMFKAFRSHKLLKTEDIQKNPSHFLQEFKHSFCARHSDKEIEYVCKIHDVLCCIKCVTLDHRMCKVVVELLDVCSGIKESDETKRLQSQLNEFLQELEKIIEVACSRDMVVKKQSDDIIAEVNSVTKKAEDMTAAYKSSVLDQLQQIGKTERLTMSEVERTCLSLKVAIQGSVELLKTFMTYGTEQQIFIIVRKLQDQIEDYKRIAVEQLSRMEKTPEFGLQMSSASTLLVQNNLGEMLQKVNIKENVLKEVNMDLVPKAEGKEDTRPISELKNVKAVNFTIHISHIHRLPCYTGATFISGNRIILVDSNNNRCLLYDSKFKQIAEKKCSSDPYGVTSLSEHKIAVTLPHQPAIQIFVVQDSLIHVNTIKMRWACWGIASLGNNELAVLCNIPIITGPGKSIIAVINLEGRENKIIEAVDTFPNAQARISYDSKYISVDKVTSRIYCYLDYYRKFGDGADIFRNKCLSAIYEDKMVAFICAPCDGCIGVDKDGNAYVSGNAGIVRLSSTGKQIGDLQFMTLTSKGLKPVRVPTADCICFSSEEPNKFVLACNAKIYVCELH